MRIKELRDGEYCPHNFADIVAAHDVVLRKRILIGDIQIVSAYFSSLKIASEVAGFLACGPVIPLPDSDISSLVISGIIPEISEKLLNLHP